MFENLRADLARYLELVDDPNAPAWRKWKAVVEAQGVWAVTTYRFGRWSFERAPRAARPLCKAAYQVLNKVMEVATGIILPASAQIGRGLYIGHFGGIIVHYRAVIGENCNLSQGVTIGVLGGPRPGVPRIGNGVYFGSGCKVLGPITVGDGATIGANAVVLDDVPSGATAVGVPARVVTKKQRAAS